MTTFILVRHAETEANVRQLWYGALDAPLTERGQRQCQAVAQRIKMLQRDMPIDHLYVSPLGRARRTAEIIGQAIDLEPQVVDGLREFNLGEWEGRSFQDLHESEKLWERWAIDTSFAPPAGESPQMFHARAVAYMVELAERHPDETLLVVGHGGFICNVLSVWLGNGSDEWRKWEPYNCAITIVAGQPHAWQGLLVNDTAHLSNELIVRRVEVYADQTVDDGVEIE